jgi:exodeoxyribonuclease-3
MNIATWNINSLKMRIESVKNWLINNPVDFLLLQEIKGLEEEIFHQFEDIGYKSYFSLQKAYNGVATLSKHDAKINHKTIPNFIDDQARYLEIQFDNKIIINAYMPNGNPIENKQGIKYLYKLNWLNAFYEHIKNLSDNNYDFIIGGDFNIAPFNQDVYNVAKFDDDASIQKEAVDIYHKLINLGLSDVVKYKYKNQKNIFTWWDYRDFGFMKNQGARIDHILLSPFFANLYKDCKLDKKIREEEKPSDHIPVICYLDY